MDAQRSKQTQCKCEQVRFWIDGQGPVSDGGTVQLKPGWHEVYAECLQAGEVVAVLEDEKYLCSNRPDLECHLRDFHFRGEEVNALLSEAPRFEWSSARNDSDCLAESCVRACEAKSSAAPYYELILDGGFSSRLRVEEAECGGAWEMPQSLWDELDPGYHELKLQALLADETGAPSASKPVRIGFSKISDPSSASFATRWEGGKEAPYKLETTLELDGKSWGGRSPIALPVPPDIGEPFYRSLLGAAGNFVAQNTNERMVYTDLSRFRAVWATNGGGSVGAPRLLPVDPIRLGRRWQYRDLLSDARGRKRTGHCAWDGRSGRMDGVAGCRAPWMDSVEAHPGAQIYWKEVPKDGWGVAWVQGVVTDLEIEPRPQTYVAIFKVRETANRSARLRLGWGTHAPAVHGRSKILPHRAKGLRLEPGESREVQLRIQVAPPPPRPGTEESPLWGDPFSLWVLALADGGKILVEDVRLHRVREGFVFADGPTDEPAEVDFYFEPFDRLPSPVDSAVSLMSERELSSWVSRGRTGRIVQAQFRRRPEANPEKALLFKRQSPFASVGPLAGPGEGEILLDASRPDRIRGRVDVWMSRDHRPTETAAFHLLAGRKGYRLRSPGRGEMQVCGGSLHWEAWTSLPYLTRGPGWTWRDTFDTPLVTNLYLTKGGRPQFDARRTRMRADEAMPLEVDLRPGESQKILVNLRARGALSPGVCDVSIGLGDLQLPLRIHVLDVDLAPERNNWIQLGSTSVWDDDEDPTNGCNMDLGGQDTRHRSIRVPDCKKDENTRAEWHYICDDDFDYLVRRIREHGHVGASLRKDCEIVEGCAGPGCPLDALGFHASRCRLATGDRPRRWSDPFSDLVQRIAAQWDSVEPLPDAPSYDLQGLWIDGKLRPWLGSSIYPAAVPMPHCWSLDPDSGCPPGVSAKMELRKYEGVRQFAAMRTIQDQRLGSRSFFAHMDAIFNGGPIRASGFRVLLDAYHAFGGGGVMTSFPADREATFAGLIERAQVGTEPPEICWDTCGQDGLSADVHDLERQMRWGLTYGTNIVPRGESRYCPSRWPLTGHLNWERFGQELERQRQLSDRANRCAPGRCGPTCYCCEYEGGGEDICSNRESGSIFPLGTCKSGARRPCRTDASESRPWCPKFSKESPVAGPTPPADIMSYVIGLDRFVALQEECEPMEPCAYKSNRFEQHGMFEEVLWKWPFNSRFSSGFWAAGTNLDAFHPYHLYFPFDGGYAADVFSNFDPWGGQSVGFIHKADSYPEEIEGECEGSCSGIVQTESWEALASGHADIQWWDTLLKHDPSPRCEPKKREAIDLVRKSIAPYGVGRGTGARSIYAYPNIPQKPNYWVMPGYPAEYLSDGDLQRMKLAVIEALTCR